MKKIITFNSKYERFFLCVCAYAGNAWGHKKHQINGRNHSMLQNVLKSHHLKTVNAMHIKRQVKSKNKSAKAKSQKTKSANKPKITTATTLSIPASLLMFVVSRIAHRV